LNQNISEFIECLEEFQKVDALLDAREEFQTVHSQLKHYMLESASLSAIRDEILKNFNELLARLKIIISNHSEQERLQHILVYLKQHHPLLLLNYPNLVDSSHQQNVESLKLLMLNNNDFLLDDVPTIGTIVIFDKNPNTRLSLKQRLESDKHVVLEAVTSQEALDFVKTAPVDVFIMDATSIDSLIPKITSLANEKRNPFIVIAVGAMDDNRVIADSFSCGAEDFIPKPVNPVLLKSRIKAALERKRLLLIRQQKMKDIESSMEDLQGTIDDIGTGIIAISEDGLIQTYNTPLFSLFPHYGRAGIRLDQLTFKEFIITNFDEDIYDPEFMDGEEEHTAKILSHLKDPQYSWKEYLKNGRIYFYETFNQSGHVTITIKDISSNSESKNQLAYLAYFDGLTGIVNRQFFVYRLKKLIEERHESTEFAVALIDLDGFKGVNDLYGHDMGDWLLVQVAQRLKSIFRQGDIVARYGGDEFTVIIHSRVEDIDIHSVAERIINGLVEPYSRGSVQLSIAASIGITFFPQDATTVNDLLQQADSAMYVVKQSGKNGYKCFNDPKPHIFELPRGMVHRKSKRVHR
jgi:diguanylate cyclase (GGDEF)-like protein